MGEVLEKEIQDLQLWANSNDVLGTGIPDVRTSASTTPLFLWGTVRVIRIVLVVKKSVIFAQYFLVTKLFNFNTDMLILWSRNVPNLRVLQRNGVLCCWHDKTFLTFKAEGIPTFIYPSIFISFFIIFRQRDLRVSCGVCYPMSELWRSFEKELHIYTEKYKTLGLQIFN